VIRRLACAALACAALTGTAGGQTLTRRATNLAALEAYPGYFHLRPIIVTGTLAVDDRGDLRLQSAGLSMPVLLDGTDGPIPDGPGEVRGEFWDIGRMRSEDPRLARLDAIAKLHVDPNAVWPKPGEVVAIVATAIEPAPVAAGPSIRTLVLEPERYLDQPVTITGQFSGRNLLGDLPDAPGRSRWDFVLRSADAAVWVSGAEPKGRDFNLSLDQRLDTERWLRVTGTLREAGGLQWIEAKPDQLALASAPEAPTDQFDAGIRVPAAPPPEAIFSAPTAGETDVPVGTTVRIQFSRDLDPKTINGHVSVRYRVATTTVPAPPAPAAPAFTAAYRPGNRELEITFAEPLEPFRTPVVALDDGILGTDGQPLKPWSVSFELGG
jgi:Bacterial Ig-like domain